MFLKTIFNIPIPEVSVSLYYIKIWSEDLQMEVLQFLKNDDVHVGTILRGGQFRLMSRWGWCDMQGGRKENLDVI